MIGIGLVHAFALVAIVYAIAYRTGGQVNPAVTIALLVTGKLRAKEGSTVYCVPNIRGCYRCRCSIFNVWKRYGLLVSRFLRMIMLLERLYWKLL